MTNEESDSLGSESNDEVPTQDAAQPTGEAIDLEQVEAAQEQAQLLLPVLSMLSTLGNPDAPAARPLELVEAFPGVQKPLRPKQLQAIKLLLGGETKAGAARIIGVARQTIVRWFKDDEGVREAYREGLEDMRGATRPLVIDGFRQGVAKLIEILTAGDDKSQLAAASQLTKLYRAEPIELAVGTDDVDGDPDAEWDRKFTTKGDAFLPHDTQLAAINCLARFLVLVAGVQSGKTDTGAINFWKRIRLEDDPTAVYYLVAPTTGIGKVMRKRFVARAPKGWLPNPQGSGQDFERTWTLKNGATVEFRSGNKPANIVAETLRGAWLDEFTLMTSQVWQVSLRGRFAATGGWAIFTGTPRGPTWAFEDVWRRTLPHDDKYDKKGNWVGFTWHSVANPRVSASEVAEAKETLPDAYYRREWEASWEAFHGQVFPDFKKSSDVFDLSHEMRHKFKGDLIDAGVDWGYGSPGALVCGRQNTDDSWDILHEVHEAKRLTSWWIERFKEAHLKFGAKDGKGIHTFWCDGAEPDRIAQTRKALRKWAKEEGLPVPRVKAGKKDRWPGIRHMASLFKQGLIRIHNGCVITIAQLQGYKFKEDRVGDDTDEIEKVNDHTVDATRYMLYSRKRASRGSGEVSMGSA